MKIGIAPLALLGLLVACDQPAQPAEKPAYCTPGTGLVGCDPAQPPHAVNPGTVGRFQIVNGTPAMSRNVMLLDTLTGDSWQICGANKSINEWCLMARESAK